MIKTRFPGVIYTMTIYLINEKTQTTLRHQLHSPLPFPEPSGPVNADHLAGHVQQIEPGGTWRVMTDDEIQGYLAEEDEGDD